MTERLVMLAEKTDFLKNGFVPLLKQIPSGRPPAWGLMTVQQMVEHFSDAVRIASGKRAFTEVVTPADRLPRMRDFLLSDHPFRENTNNPLLPAAPPPVRHESLDEALAELEEELRFFFLVFEEQGLQVTRNPLFGDLDYEQNIHLLYKHALHHLKQFGQTPS